MLNPYHRMGIRLSIHLSTNPCGIATYATSTINDEFASMHTPFFLVHIYGDAIPLAKCIAITKKSCKM